MPGAMFPALERALVLTGTGPLVLLDGRSQEELETTGVEADFLAEVGSDLTFFRTADRPTALGPRTGLPPSPGSRRCRTTRGRRAATSTAPGTTTAA